MAGIANNTNQSKNAIKLQEETSPYTSPAAVNNTSENSYTFILSATQGKKNENEQV